MCTNGIQCAKQYQPLYRYHLFDKDSKDIENKKLLPNTDLFYDQMISVPFHENLAKDDLQFILQTLLTVVNNIK